jgi:hypothetical protein
MVLGNGGGNGAGHVRFENCLQSVVFAANLIVSHLTSMLCAKHMGRQRRKTMP